ncbi:hypothetical protein [Salibacterium lacus]|uniref:Uncharacterized protein n=1 Tax=Salibacterium lacus TaxID=1898109 RepID=A0ABW5T6C3_9BACI
MNKKSLSHDILNPKKKGKEGKQTMKEMDISDLNQYIQSNKKEANYQVNKELSGIKKRRLKYRKRSDDEIEALNRICIEKWKRAEREGKIKRTGKKELYYAFD